MGTLMNRSDGFILFVVIAITAFLLQHVHYSSKLESAERAMRMCRSVLTASQRQEVREQWDSYMDAQEDLAELSRD